MSSVPDSTQNAAPERTDAAGAAPTVSPRVRRPLSRKRRWLFRAAAMSLVFVLLAVIELALRLAGSGQELVLVKHAGPQAPAGTFLLNPEIDRVYYGPSDLNGPESRPFLLPKPKDTYRIVVIGGSTVVGFPYSQDLAFPRFLELALRQQAPDRTIEVLNAGIVAVNTFGEADMVEQAVACSPDLIVVYTGHNEFIGPGGVASKFGGVSSAWTPALFTVRRTRSYQLAMRNLIPKKTETQQLVSQLLGDEAVTYDGPKFRRAERSFRDNLNRMVRVCAEARLPLLLTTPVVNLRSYAPISSLHRDDLTSRKRAAWQEGFDQGEKLLLEEKYAAALDSLDQALAIDDGHALLAFRRGQALQGLQRWDEARAAYRRACDLDGCRFRAPSSFGRIAREVAETAEASTTHFIDTDSKFARGVPNGIPGAESLLEHVHFTNAGNWRMALILAEKIVTDLWRTDWRNDHVPDEAERDRLSGAMVQDHLIAQSLVIMMWQKAPLSGSPEASQQIEAMTATIHEEFDQIPRPEAEIFADVSTLKLQLDLVGVLLARYAEAGLEDERGPLLRRAVLRQPWDVKRRMMLADWDAHHGRVDEARRILDETESWWPDASRAAQARKELVGEAEGQRSP